MSEVDAAAVLLHSLAFLPRASVWSAALASSPATPSPPAAGPDRCGSYKTKRPRSLSIVVGAGYGGFRWLPSWNQQKGESFVLGIFFNSIYLFIIIWALFVFAYGGACHVFDFILFYFLRVILDVPRFFFYWMMGGSPDWKWGVEFFLVERMEMCNFKNKNKRKEKKLN